MPIGTGIIYNVGDLILGTVSGSGTAFLETKIAAATSSIVYFDSNARINSASLNSITVGTASYVSGSTSIITNLTASNISASGTGSFGMVGIGTTVPSAKLEVANTGRILGVLRLHITPQTTFYDNTFAVGTDGGGANGFIYTSGTGGTFPLDTYGELILQAGPKTGYNNGISLVTGTTSPSVKLRIAEGGNVGIGTTSPDTNLEIYKSVSVAGESYQDILTVTAVDNDGGYFYTGLGAGIAFRSGKTSANVYGPSIMGSIYGANSGDESIANGYLSFHTRNSNTVAERMRVTNTGNVGIGTTSPVARLAVVPSGSAFDSSNTMVAYFGKTTTNGYGSTFIRVARSDSTTTTGSNAEYTDIEHNSGGSGPFRYGTYLDTNIINGGAATNGVYGSINFVTSGSTRMTIAGGTSAGNVGIGTTSPAAMLHVQKSQNSETTVIINNTNAGTAAAARLDLQSHASNYLTLQAYGQNFSGNVCGIAGAKLNTILDNALTANSTGLLIGTTSTNPLYFATANAVKMMLSAGGNLGIGTTSPSGILDVYGATSIFRNDSAGATTLYLRNWTSGGTAQMIFGVASNDDQSTTLSFASNIFSIGNYGDPGSEIRFGTRNNSTADIRVTINQDGKVGIGTTIPNELLEVSGTSPIIRVLAISGSSTLRLTDNGVRNWDLKVVDVNDYFEVGGTSATSLVVTGAGNIGVGTTSPAVKLDVVGDIRTSTGILFGTDTAAANLLDDYEEGTWTGTITGGTFTNLAVGRYTKIGRQVFACINPNTTAITGNLIISGLPFTAGSRSAMVGTGLPPSGVTYIPRFVDGDTIDINVAGTYAGGSLSTYFACIYEV